MTTFSHDDVEVISEELAFQGFYQIRKIQLKHQLFAGGTSQVISRELFLRHDAVGVLLYDPVIDAVALIEQFRIGVAGSDVAKDKNISPWLLELVAGLIDKKEDPHSVAEREAVEEAGADIESLELIAEYYSSPGGSNEYFYLFAGKADLTHAGGLHGLEEEGEDIRVHIVPVAQLWQMLDDGKLINAHTLIAVQWLRQHHQRLKNLWCA